MTEKILTVQDMQEYKQYTIPNLKEMLLEQRNRTKDLKKRLDKFIVDDKEATVADYTLLSAQYRQSVILEQKLVEVIDWRLLQSA